jgi:hypothetical protein
VNELFPSDIRSLGVGITFNGKMCGNNQCFGLPLSNWKFEPIWNIFLLCWYVVMLWELFTIPDKRGLSLAMIEAKLSSSASNKTD